MGLHPPSATLLLSQFAELSHVRACARVFQEIMAGGGRSDVCLQPVLVFLEQLDLRRTVAVSERRRWTSDNDMNIDRARVGPEAVGAAFRKAGGATARVREEAGNARWPG